MRVHSIDNAPPYARNLTDSVVADALPHFVILHGRRARELPVSGKGFRELSLVCIEGG